MTDMVLLDSISIDRPASGWRDVDSDRIQELMGVFYSGNWGMHVFGEVSLLSTTPLLIEDKRIIDDGLSTVMALLEMKKAHESNQEQTPAGEPWPQNIVSFPGRTSRDHLAVRC